MPEVKEYEHREILDELWNVRLYGECIDKYDVNKVYSIIYSATGISGDTIRSIALNILEYFVEYVDECEPCYIPMNSTEPMLHPSVVRDMYQYLVSKKQQINIGYPINTANDDLALSLNLPRLKWAFEDSGS